MTYLFILVCLVHSCHSIHLLVVVANRARCVAPSLYIKIRLLRLHLSSLPKPESALFPFLHGFSFSGRLLGEPAFRPTFLPVSPLQKSFPSAHEVVVIFFDIYSLYLFGFHVTLRRPSSEQSHLYPSPRGLFVYSPSLCCHFLRAPPSHLSENIIYYVLIDIFVSNFAVSASIVRFWDDLLYFTPSGLLSTLTSRGFSLSSPPSPPFLFNIYIIEKYRIYIDLDSETIWNDVASESLTNLYFS